MFWQENIQNKTNNLFIGVDVEFEELENFNNYNVVTPKFVSLREPIGADGEGHQVEIRPRQSLSCNKVIDNSRKLIQILTYECCPISVKGDVFSLGCHIHFGNFLFSNDTIRNLCIKQLDEYIGELLLPLSGSARGKFKKLSHVKKKDYGFEYKTLPSAIYWYPQFILSVLNASKIIALNSLNKEKTKLDDIEDYLKIINKYYQIYRSKYNGKAINSNWTEVNTSCENEDIIFNDYWSPQNKKIFKIAILQNDFFQILFSRSYMLILYGLKSRKKVYAGLIYNRRREASLMTVQGKRIYFGIPYVYRNDNLSYTEAEKIVSFMVNKLRKIIK